MPFDNICKFICEQYPERYAAWRVKNLTSPVTVLKTELGNDPIRADAVSFLQTQERILHLEFQVDVQNSEPPVPFRMLDYWVRLYRKYRLPIEQVLILLKETSASLTLPNTFCVENTSHQYQVVRLWQEPPDSFMQDPALLPLAVLAGCSNPNDLLNRVAEQIKTIENRNERKVISNCTQILAGLRFEKDLIHQSFK